jgi:hypothetical protein
MKEPGDNNFKYLKFGNPCLQLPEKCQMNLPNLSKYKRPRCSQIVIASEPWERACTPKCLPVVRQGYGTQAWQCHSIKMRFHHYN